MLHWKSRLLFGLITALVLVSAVGAGWTWQL